MIKLSHTYRETKSEEDFKSLVSYVEHLVRNPQVNVLSYITLLT